MSGELWQLWVYLAADPLLGLTLTLAVYVAALRVFRRLGGHPLANPVLLAVLVLSGLLYVTGTEYRDYFEGAKFVHFMLGPATVALAVPLYRQWRRVRNSAASVLVALVCGSLTAAASAVGIAALLGGSRVTLLSLAPKSVTTPVAMGVSQGIGGLPSLTAVLVILTGIVGAVVGGAVLDLVRVHDPRARGLAIGTAAHGIGTARALQMGEVVGAFAGLAMGLNALATAVLLPLLARLVF